MLVIFLSHFLRFLCQHLFKSTFLVFTKFLTWKKRLLGVHQSSFFRLKFKLFVLRPVCLWNEAWISFFFSSCLNWCNRPYGCWTKSWTNFFISKPYRGCRSGSTFRVRDQQRFLTFNPPRQLVVTNLHFRTEWQQSCSSSADINSAIL